MKLKIPFLRSFKPGREGIQHVLGELEAEIMETLWQNKDAFTGRRIYENLKEKKKIAYTTVLTVLDRLVHKGLVIKEKNKENTYIFTPKITKEEFKKEISINVVKSLMDFAGKGAVTAFVNALESADPKTIEELEKLLREKQRERVRDKEIVPEDIKKVSINGI